MEKRKIGAVYETTDYDMFRYLDGNRRDAEIRGRKLLSGIKKYGQLVPITVNEKMEVIDGQARLWACKYLGIPVKYTVVTGIGYKECIAINTVQKNWALADYVKSYADMGNQSYKYLMALKSQFPKFSYTLIGSLAAKRYTNGGNGEKMRNGETVISKDNYEDAIKTFGYLMSVIDRLPVGGTSLTNYEVAIAVLLGLNSVDNDRLYKAIQTYSFMLKPAATVRYATEMLDDCYNYCRKNKVHFTEHVRDYLEAI